MIIRTQTLWRGGRVVECGRLEICFRVTPNVGSNPTLSVELIDNLVLSLRSLRDVALSWVVSARAKAFLLSPTSSPFHGQGQTITNRNNTDIYPFILLNFGIKGTDNVGAIISAIGRRYSSRPKNIIDGDNSAASDQL